MAHDRQQVFCLKVKSRYPEMFQDKDVLDIGSLNINGTNKPLFENCRYTGVDLGPGPNVDIIGPAHTLDMPDDSFDVVISTECLEHDKHWEDTLRFACRVLKPGGLLVLTLASEGRKDHGTTAATPEDSPFTNDYYRNLYEKDLIGILNETTFENPTYSIDVADLQFYGIRK